MSVTSLICTYLYGTLKVIQTAITAYTKVAKNLLKKIDTLVQTMMTTVYAVLNTTMKTVISLIKQYEKTLVDMLGIGGNPDSIWCSNLFKCIALLNDLLDADGWLYKMLEKWLGLQCHPWAKDLLANINSIVSDFTEFANTLCKWGLTFEFGISFVKQGIDWCRKQLDNYFGIISRNKDRIINWIQGYLDTVIDWGIIDMFEQLMSFFTCVFDDGASCAEIATASNYYKSAMAFMQLEKSGDGYDVSSRYKNKAYGGLEGACNKISNLSMQLEEYSKTLVNAEQLKKANNAFNLSSNVFPGGSSWDEIKSGNWENNAIYKKYNTYKDNIMACFEQEAGYPLDLQTLEDGTFIDSDGEVWVRDGCDYRMLRGLPQLPPEKQGPIYVSINVDGYDGHTGNNNGTVNKGGSNGVMLDDKGNFITVTEAASIIANDPDSEFAQQCRKAYEFVKGLTRNADGAVRYADAVI